MQEDHPILLDIVVPEREKIQGHYSSDGEETLERGNPLLVKDLGFRLVDGVGLLDIEGDDCPALLFFT